MRRMPFNESSGRSVVGPSSEEDLLSLSIDIDITEEHRQVFKKLDSGVPAIFVTGYGGTGKTALISHIQKNSRRNLVVVAPTAVAALNAKGVTIHSFFHFPPRMITDEDIKKVTDRKLLESLSLLVIDEASMVRADLIDAMDKFLRLNRESSEPFGGVQVLLVGDLFQLPPVVTPKDRELLTLMNYKSPYFFSAKVFHSCPLETQHLTKVYRQSDEKFIKILNSIRLAKNLDKVLPVINKRCVKPEDDLKSIITLSCTNKVADDINRLHLAKIPRQLVTFTGEATGKFMLEEARLPSPMNLSLKVGAQVMFTQNDQLKQWVNGTIGRVVELVFNTIRVEVEDENGIRILDVPKATWESYRYTFDSKLNRVVPEVIGSYRQYPLMLAWAVTIHKGQGKTLDKVIIDLGTGSFAHGQVYVALSRCRALEDIYLVKPIKAVDVKCDPLVKMFYEVINKNDSSK